MAEGDKKDSCGCKLNDCIASWLVFILVAGVIVCALFYMVSDLVKAPEVQDFVIRVELSDSIKNTKTSPNVYYTEGIDSLISVVKKYEAGVDNKYQYIVEKQQEDDRMKTWGAMIIGVIVSLCGFWGYKSMKDLREDITANTEKTSELAVNSYLDNHLQGKVNDALQNTLKSDIVDIIKNHVFNTLNSSEDPIVKSKVNERIESDEFDKKLNDIVEEKVKEVVDDVINSMTINYTQYRNTEGNRHPEKDAGIEMT